MALIGDVVWYRPSDEVRQQWAGNQRAWKPGVKGGEIVQAIDVRDKDVALDAFVACLVTALEGDVVAGVLFTPDGQQTIVQDVAPGTNPGEWQERK